jgi:hypothetical protein
MRGYGDTLTLKKWDDLSVQVLHDEEKTNNFQETAGAQCLQ